MINLWLHLRIRHPILRNSISRSIQTLVNIHHSPSVTKVAAEWFNVTSRESPVIVQSLIGRDVRQETVGPNRRIESQCYVAINGACD